jgi:hypothetical protein
MLAIALDAVLIVVGLVPDEDQPPIQIDPRPRQVDQL